MRKSREIAKEKAAKKITIRPSGGRTHDIRIAMYHIDAESI